MAENADIKPAIISDNEFASDVASSNFDVSTEDFANARAMPLTEDETMRYCKHCDYQAPDWPLFAIHVLKPSHVKKVAEAMKVRVAIDPILMSITCDVCNVTCSGHIPWNAHLMGSKHRKAIQENQGGGGPITTRISENDHNRKPYEKNPQNRQLHLKNVEPPDENDFNNYPDPLIGLEYVSETEGRGIIPWYHCSLCDVKFDNNLKFAHLIGQKHRIAVLKIKCPHLIVGLDSNTMKRSEITPILLELARNLEQEEGRQEVKKKFRKYQPHGRGAQRGRGGNRGTTRGLTRGRGNRGMSHTQGRGYNVGSYPNQPGQGGRSTYNESLSNFAYNSSNVGPDYGLNYPQSYETEHIHHGGSSSYHRGGGQAYSAQPHPSGQVYPMANTNRAPKTLDTRKEHLKSEITANLAAALGDLTKLVHDEEDASVALHVSNALTESLLKYRMSGLQ